MKYNNLEKKIALVLSNFPKTKLFIKKSYQRFNAFFYKKKYTYECNFPLKELSYQGEESFFGYYDKSPINETNTYIIFQSVTFSTKQTPRTDLGISIVLYNIIDDEYEKIDTSYAYNWQQGSKLMWINNDEFVYNNFDKENMKYTSKIYNVKTQNFRIINYPIYDATNKFGVSLNFERLNIGRGDYAYNNLKQSIDWDDNSCDGLYYIDFDEETSNLIVSLDQVIKNNYKSTMRGAKHKFNHIMLSPNKEKMMFMHRWFTSNGQRFDSLYICSIKGNDLKLIADDGMVSHCCWKNDNEIVAYLRDKEKGDKFYLIDINSKEKKIIGMGQLDKFGDGHPSCNNEKILFDTYPNKSRMKELYVFDIKKNQLDQLGEFYESLNYYAETRCDLHPRYSFDGKMIFIDTVHSGKRKLNYFSLS